MTFGRSPTEQRADAYMEALRESDARRWREMTRDELIRVVPALSPGEAAKVLARARG